MKDGELGFSGNRDFSVLYELTEENGLRITYDVVSDADTILNLTNHCYFNLDGHGAGQITDHELQLFSHAYTPADAKAIPNGDILRVEGTPMDFTEPHLIGERIDADFDQLKMAGGYDHNYVTDNYAKGNRRLIATAYSDKSGIAMDVTSDCPCVQLYAGNFIEQEKGKNGHIYTKRDAFCLETQVEPNAVNVEAFHSPILDAGERYYSETIYCFSVRK